MDKKRTFYLGLLAKIVKTNSIKSWYLKQQNFFIFIYTANKPTRVCLGFYCVINLLRLTTIIFTAKQAEIKYFYSPLRTLLITTF